MLVATIIVPVFLAALMTVVQFGLAFHARNVMAGAAQDGATAAARSGADPAAAVILTRSLVDGSASNLLSNYDATVDVADGRATMTVTGQAVSLVPFLDGISIAARGSAPLEEFDAQGNQ